MRNDARPIGHRQSPVPRQQSADDSRQSTDSRESVTHDRQSHVVNRGADERDPVMPSDESTLNTKI